MFTGHYGPAFAAKAISPKVPLWVLFIAVQWMDVVWSLLVALHVEKLRIVPGFTESNPLDLYYMPYTHGLFGALALSVVFGLLAQSLLRGTWQEIFVVVASAVFSHWLLDLVVHVPDLPLVGNSMKVGFGLWRHVRIALPVEIATLIAGAWIYARYAPSKNALGDVWLWGYVGLMVAIQIYATFWGQPTTPMGEAGMAIAMYLVFTALAWAVDRARATQPLQWRSAAN
ncbi:MAG TPA: hypothetical protein VK759_01135 [Rhizomicrobium sp.]|nr:hypothetical protein [Rhizomicrobium sp.]